MKVYVCGKCNKKCKSQAGLTSHLATHDKDVPSKSVLSFFKPKKRKQKKIKVAIQEAPKEPEQRKLVVKKVRL